VGSRGSRAQAAVELAGESIPAAACYGNSPDLAKTGVPGVKSARTRVRRVLRSMGNPHEATEQWIGAWSELATAGGGAGPWGSPANERSRSAGLRLGREASACVHRAKTRHVRSGVALQGTRHREAAVRAPAERRRAALRPRVQAMGLDTLRKRSREAGRSLPRVRGGWGRSAEASTARSGGGARSCSCGPGEGARLRLLDPTRCFNVELRTQGRGQ
jgi:hypothetical protein